MDPRLFGPLEVALETKVFRKFSVYLVADHCGPKMLGRAEAAHVFFEVGNHRFWGMINCGFHELEIFFFFKAAEQRNIRVRKKSWYQNEKKMTVHSLSFCVATGNEKC